MSSSKSEKKVERLEIPAQTSLERRLLVDDARPSTKPQIFKPETSALLSQLQQFLPQMKESTIQLLQEQDVSNARMEQHGDEEGPYVELDLACGLVDLKDDAAVRAAERSLINSGVVVERFEGASTDSSSDDSDDDTEEDSDGEIEGNEANVPGEKDLDELETEGMEGVEGAGGAASQKQKNSPNKKSRKTRKRAGIEELS